MATIPGFTHNDDTISFDLEPFIRDAIDKMNFEIDRRAEAKVAAVLRDRGWTCIPPAAEGTGQPTNHEIRRQS